MIEEEEEQKNLPLNGERHFPISQKCVRSSERDTSGETKRETGGGRRIPCESRERERCAGLLLLSFSAATTRTRRSDLGEGQQPRTGGQRAARFMERESCTHT